MIYEDKIILCEHPLVSAYIFTYNQQNLVRKTIESFLSQECSFEYEIIICDDCSKDGTLSVCLEYQRQHPYIIRVIANDKNMGIRGNFINNILSYSRGKYIAYCAGDDWWSDKYKLQKQVSFLEVHQEVSMVHSHARIFVENTNTYSRNLIGRNRNTFEENVLTNGVAALTTCFTKKSFLDYVAEIDPISLPFSEDYPMVLWFSYRTKVCFMEDALCTYRLQTNSLSHTTDKLKIYKGPQDVLDCRLFFINKFNIKDEDLIRKVYLSYYLDRLQYAHLLKDTDGIKNTESFFKGNHYYTFFFLSKIYTVVGRHERLNKMVSLLARFIRKVHPSHRFYI